MLINIKKTHPDAKVPLYATDGAGCFDLFALTVDGCHQVGRYVEPGFPVICRTGLALEIPPSWVMVIFSRSGHGFNHDTRLANCVGVIDSDYRGEVMVKLTADDDPEHRGGLNLYVSPGDRVAQAMLQPVERITFNVAEWLSETERGTGGFGSTGAA